MNQMKSHVFISYSHKDLVFADRLAPVIEAAGYEVLLDRHDLHYGAKWKDELSDFVRQAEIIVFVVSPNSVSSQYCMSELDQARNLNKRIISIVLRQVPPEKLPEYIRESIG